MGWLFLFLMAAGAFLNSKGISGLNDSGRSSMEDAPIDLAQPDVIGIEKAIFRKINEFRLKNKLNALRWDDTLVRSSQFHLKSMRDERYFDHENKRKPTYPKLKERVKKQGGHFNYLAENLIQYFPFKFEGKTISYLVKHKEGKVIYLNPKSKQPLKVLSVEEYATRVVWEWIHSEAHKTNLLGKNFTALGLSVYFPDYLKESNMPPTLVVSNFGGY